MEEKTLKFIKVSGTVKIGLVTAIKSDPIHIEQCCTHTLLCTSIPAVSRSHNIMINVTPLIVILSDAERRIETFCH